MNRTKKAPGANRGGKEISATGAINERQIDYNLFVSPLSSGLNALLDQALDRFERHLSLAQFHAAEARKHRKVLRSLQALVPPQQRGKGGAA